MCCILIVSESREQGMTLSKSKIDRAGRILASLQGELTEEALEAEEYFDEYRKTHLQPLSETTLELQNWLTNYGDRYYVAQRLKRKPQILRKLQRLSVRLTQLQDIGGCRIIVGDNRSVERLLDFISEKLVNQTEINLVRRTDYREMGRDDSGYRAVHLILENAGRSLELQIRSSVQHYWAESIERTSVIYGRHLKEQDGDPIVINYFKQLSDIFFEIEAGREPSTASKLALDRLRGSAEKIISVSDTKNVLQSFVNEDVVRTLVETEGRNPSGINNWIIVFDWNLGSFVTWDKVSKNPDDAVASYIDYERQYPADSNFEVVMIGSSDVATVRQTHSHYFGIDSFENILSNFEGTLVDLSRRLDIDVTSRQILSVLVRKKYWGKKGISSATLRNHYCKEAINFESSLKSLTDRGLILEAGPHGAISLNVKKKMEIEAYL